MAGVDNAEKQVNEDRIDHGINQPTRHSSESSTSETTVDETQPPTSAENADVEKQSGQNTQSAFSRVLSRTVSRTSNLPEPGPPPDGGFEAWGQAFASHLVIFNTWGYVNSYGVFQTYYTTSLNQTPSAISWVGSIQIFLLFGIGTFSGRMTDGGYFRPVFAVGTFMLLLGVFMTSLCTEYYQLFLSHGVLTGLGMGMLFCPTVALMPTYFNKNRSLAIAIGASGSATGGIVFPVIAQQLLPRAGFGWTLRTMGFVMMVTQLIAWSVLKPRLPPRKTGPLVEWAAFKETPYLMFTIGMFLAFLGLFPGFYYVGAYATNILDLPKSESISLLLIMNGVGFFGRLLPAVVADRYTGPLNLLIPCAIGSAVVIYGWIAVYDRAGIYVFAVMYGLLAAGIQSLFPATLSRLTTDVKKMGVRMGMVFSVISFACLTGSPIAGALVSSKDGEYLYEQIYTATVLLVGACALFLSRIARTGMNFKVRI